MSEIGLATKELINNNINNNNELKLDIKSVLSQTFIFNGKNTKVEGDDINLSWHTGCIHLGKGKYDIGAIGSKGPRDNTRCCESNISNNDVKNKNSEIPDALVLYINTPTKKSFELVKEVITKISLIPEQEIEIKWIISTQEIEKRIGVKNEYQDEIKSIQEYNELYISKYEKALKQLNDLDVDTDDVGAPRLKSIPNEYYEWEKTTNYNLCKFNIACHKNTEFYQFFKDNGILDSLFPECY